MKIVMFMIMFLLIGAFFIIFQNNLSLNNPENIGKFAEEYTSWLGKIVNNAGSLTGYVLKLEWLPNESEGFKNE